MAFTPARTRPIRARCRKLPRWKPRWPPCSRLSPSRSSTHGLSPIVPDLLWSLTDLFHRKAARVQRQLDDNEDRQRRSQTEQDGSEIRSVELERLIAQGQTLIEKRNAFEMLRDRAAEQYEAHTGSAWRPRAGSMVNHKHLTAAMIDSRDFIAAKRKAETEVHLPSGPKIAFGGGVDCNDHHAIWAALDKVHAKHPDMVLIHGGSPRGAERIAACWADKRKVTQIAFKPDWTREGKAAPFKRNDRMLDVLPIGLDRVPRLRHHRQSRRQGQEARHPPDGLPQARRIGAAPPCSGGGRPLPPELLFPRAIAPPPSAARGRVTEKKGEAPGNRERPANPRRRIRIPGDLRHDQAHHLHRFLSHRTGLGVRGNRRRFPRGSAREGARHCRRPRPFAGTLFRTLCGIFGRRGDRRGYPGRRKGSRMAKPRSSRLHLAAEDLLSALEKALTALNTAPRFKVPKLSTDSYAIAAECGRAIAKAKGENNPNAA